MSCLDDIVKVVESSAQVNVAQLVGTQEGENIVPTYNWAGFFTTHLRKLRDIKKFRHLRFNASTQKLSMSGSSQMMQLRLSHLCLTKPGHHQ